MTQSEAAMFSNGVDGNSSHAMDDPVEDNPSMLVNGTSGMHKDEPDALPVEQETVPEDPAIGVEDEAVSEIKNNDEQNTCSDEQKTLPEGADMGVEPIEEDGAIISEQNTCSDEPGTSSEETYIGVEPIEEDDAVVAESNAFHDETETLNEEHAIGVQPSEEDEATVAELIANDLLEIEGSDCDDSVDEPMEVDASTSGIFEGASMGTIQNVAFGDMQDFNNGPKSVSDAVMEDGCEAEEAVDENAILDNDGGANIEVALPNLSLAILNTCTGAPPSPPISTPNVSSGVLLERTEGSPSLASDFFQKAENNNLAAEPSLLALPDSELKTDSRENASTNPFNGERTETSEVEGAEMEGQSMKVDVDSSLKGESASVMKTDGDLSIKDESVSSMKVDGDSSMKVDGDSTVQVGKTDSDVALLDSQPNRKRSVDELNGIEEGIESKKARMDVSSVGENSETKNDEGKTGEGRRPSSSSQSAVERCWVDSDDEDADDPDDVPSPEGSGDLVIDEGTSAPAGTNEIEETSSAKEKESDRTNAEVAKTITPALVDTDDENADDPGSPSDSSTSAKELKRSALADSDTDSGESQSRSCSPSASQTARLLPVLRKLRRGSLAQISKYDLEELINQKVCEAITERSPMMGELRRRCQAMEEQCEKWRQIASSCKKQLRDMETLLKRYLEDSESGNRNALAPLKVTRSVGLQVSISTRKPPPVNPNRSPSKSPAKPQSKPGPPPLVQPNFMLVKKKQVKAMGPRPPLPNRPAMPIIRPKPVNKMMPPLITRPSVRPLNMKAVRPAAPFHKPPMASDGVIDLTDEPPMRQPVSGKGIVPAPGQQIAFVMPSAKGQPQKYLIATPTSVVKTNKPYVAPKALHHPALLPSVPANQPMNPGWGKPPPRPGLKISNTAAGIVLSWDMPMTSEFAAIRSYQLYAYQEGTEPPHSSLWRQVGDVSALPLPMACTLSCFVPGHKYHFSVRAVDVHTRVGYFSFPGSILLKK